MDLGLSEAQALLQRSARETLARACPPARVRAAEDRADGFDRGLWTLLAELGWLGLAIPEQYGGLGLTLLDQTLLAEELGRALVPGPVVETSVILPRLVMAVGSAAQRDALLPAVAAGNLVVALALAEAEARWDPARLSPSATREDHGLRITTVRPFVPFAATADVFLLPVRVGHAPEATASVLLDRRAPGVAIEPIPSLTGFALGAVRVTNVRADRDQWLGEGEDAQRALDHALVAGTIVAAAYQVGMAEAVLEMTVAYAKHRVAFGQPIGAFQAIQHKLVGMLSDLDGARLATREAAWRFDEGEASAALAASLANVLASEGLRSTCFEAHEVHAGVGFMMDYDLQLYYRRAKWLEQFLGHPVEHRERLAAALLDG
jgi:alkylation response protein AidB-like acyl-CoA dehydrogenase